ncbi:MAG TPA: SPOR domain-containing protein [Fibrobacteria bacterium]|nr:SPOR domain-containing protein [Fibrobacteria bacterium]
MRSSTRKRSRNRRVRPFLAGLAAAALWTLAGCAGAAKRGEDGPRTGSEAAGKTVSAPTEVPEPSKRFEEPGELDRLLDAKPIALAAVRPASQAAPAGSPAPKPEPVSKGKGNFRIQIGAESDVDAAQNKKAEYEKLLGGAVDVVFDAPYYKLRWGFFNSKQDAEDKLLELSDLKIQGFVVKQ